MNVDQQQQQQQQQQPPPPALLSTETYGGGGYNVVHSTSMALQPATATTTYVTIGMLPPPQSTSSATSPSTALPHTTSTFKTPLLPMPSLADIEGGILQPVMGQPIPGGILKYPTAHTLPRSMQPIDRGTGPGPGPPHTQPTVQPPATLALKSAMEATSSQCGTLQSHAKLLQATPAGPQRPLPPLTMSMPIAVTSLSGASGMPASGMGNSKTIPNPSSNPGSGHKPTTTTTTTTNNSAATSSGGSGASSTSAAAKSKSQSKCCACFGSGRGRHTALRARQKRKGKSQSMWAALLTNLGICALLLAYTLLGSFIFLTIESEDYTLLHQQRTLASTKRMGLGGRGGRIGPSGVGHGHGPIPGDGGRGSGHIYHTQQPPQRLDNATAATMAASSSSSSSSSSSREHALLEGIVPLNGNGDFAYGEDNDAGPQLALSADTYDVRQRTIENIWDITVSLNILYKENWTKLAALEIAKFQDQLIKRLNEDALLQLSHDMDGDGNGVGDGTQGGGGSVGGGGVGGGGGGGSSGGNNPATEAVLLHTHHLHGLHHRGNGPHEWNFAKAFLYSLTVLTTIGYGNVAPRTTLGRLVTLVYALFGIPLTLVYLSSTGGILAKVAREVFSKALCCCLCSNCGYCCYDEKRMAEKERRTKRKRQHEELRKQQAAMQEPYYVRSGSMHDSFQTPEKQPSTPGTSSGMTPDIDSLSASESRGSMHGLSILAPILLCLSMMIIYIVFGAVVLYRLENWPLLDGIYFCFMSLSTIGFGDMLPGIRRDSTTTTWFCSIYIMSGMALTAMCFNVIHEEIVHRIKIVVEFKKTSALEQARDEPGYYLPP